MYKTIHIKKHERGLWFRRGDLVDVLHPGTYRIPFWNLRRDVVTIYDTTDTRLTHAKLDVLLTSGTLRDQFHVVSGHATITCPPPAERCTAIATAGSRSS